MFSTQSDNCIPFVHNFDFISLFAAESEEPKIGKSGKGLTLIKEYSWSCSPDFTITSNWHNHTVKPVRISYFQI